MRNFVSNVSTEPSCYVEQLLQSGLLLDEDVECILVHYTNDDDYNTSYRISLTQMLLGGFSAATSVFMIQKKFTMAYLTIVASPVVFISTQYLREILYRRKQRHNIEILIKMIGNVSKMNRSIVEFFKRRNMSGATADGIFDPYTQPFQELIGTIFNEETNLLYNFRKYIAEFGNYVPLLKTDYAHLDNIELNQFTTSNITSIDDCVFYLQRLCDIYVLVVSNILTCLAITLCPNMGTKYDFKTDEILDSIVPKMKAVCLKCYNNVKGKFNDVKFYYMTKKQTRQPVRPALLNSPSRLHMATYDLMTRTCELIEKSQVVYQQLKEDDEPNISELKTMSACIGDLHKQALDYSQSLDLLHKLYEVEINKSTSPNIVAKDLSTKSSVISPVEAPIVDASLNSNEPTEDEEYELYIGVHEISPESTSFSYNEDYELRKYASILGQELKQKLKTHSRFVAAQKKRGIIDEEPENVETETLPVELVEEETQRPLPISGDFNEAKAISPPPPPPLVPPPPPPPMPAIHVDDTSDTVPNFLDYIRTLPRQIEEETFE